MAPFSTRRKRGSASRLAKGTTGLSEKQYYIPKSKWLVKKQQSPLAHGG
ncbi:hypothetical protein GC56T2_2817 [Geobacillus sp. C56-T2]|nr:hypothetical protein GC56T2_2817 [Geobacillus sp. C56-T2]